MKIKTSTITWLIVGFIWSIFMGVTATSIGLGAAFPSLNLVAKPFVCPTGQMNYQQIVSNPLPGTTYTQVNWYCVDERSGQKTELEIFPMSLYAGAIYGVLIFVSVLIVWYFYRRWDPSKETEEVKKRVAWIQSISVIVIIVGVTLFNLMPLFRSMTATPEPTTIPDATATSLALTYEALTSKITSDFSSTDKPLANWNGIPIMPQAIAGQQANNGTYTFKAPVDSGTIESYYSDKLKSLGWNLADSRWQGMKFTKDKSVLLVTLAPAADEESWVVTLVLVP
jgi:hypothetical protein